MFDKDDQDISQIIDTGLEAILSGRATLDQFLAQYPEQAAILRPELESAMWLVAHREEVSPRPGFLRSSRKRVIARIKQEASSSGAKRSIFGFVWPQKIAYHWAAALMVLILFFSGTGGVVSAAQGALPGEDLYGVKRVSEEIAFTLTFDEVKCVALSAAFTQRRLDEVLALLEKGDQENLAAALQDFEQQVNKTIALLESTKSTSPAEQKELAISIYQNFLNQAGRLSSLYLTVPDELRAQIESAEALMLFGAMEAAEEANSIFDPLGTPIVVFTLTPSLTNTLAPSSTPTVISLPDPSSTPVPTNTAGSTFTPDQGILDIPSTETETDIILPDGTRVTKTPRPTNIHRPAKPVKEEKPPKPEKPEKEEKEDKDK